MGMKKPMKRPSQVSARSSEASAHVDGDQQIDDDTIGPQQTDEVGYVEGDEDDENLSATVKIDEEENDPEQDDDLAPQGSRESCNWDNAVPRMTDAGDSNDVADDVV